MLMSDQDWHRWRKHGLCVCMCVLLCVPGVQGFVVISQGKAMRRNNVTFYQVCVLHYVCYESNRPGCYSVWFHRWERLQSKHCSWSVVCQRRQRLMQMHHTVTLFMWQFSPHNAVSDTRQFHQPVESIWAFLFSLCPTAVNLAHVEIQLRPGVFLL